MLIGLLLASCSAAPLGHADAVSPAAAEAAAKLEELTAEGRPRSGLNFAPPPLLLRYSPDLAHKFAGQLVAQIMDTRTKEQFLRMLKRAGSE